MKTRSLLGGILFTTLIVACEDSNGPTGGGGQGGEAIGGSADDGGGGCCWDPGGGDVGGAGIGGDNAGGAASSGSLEIEQLETWTTENLLAVSWNGQSALVGGEGRTLRQLGAGDPLDMTVGLPDSATLKVTSVARTTTSIYAAIIDLDQQRYAEIHRLEKGWIPLFWTPEVPSCLDDASLATQGERLLGTCRYYPWTIRLEPNGETETYGPAGYKIFASASHVYIADFAQIREVDPMTFDALQTWSIEDVVGVVDSHDGRVLAYGEQGIVELGPDGAADPIDAPTTLPLRAAATIGTSATVFVGDGGTILVSTAEGEFVAVEGGTDGALVAISGSATDAVAVGENGTALKLTLVPSS